MNLKKVLILGAGLVTRPIVRYLLDCEVFHVTVASRTVSKAESLIDGHPRGKAASFDITRDGSSLPGMVEGVDLVVSLLPYIHHVNVARQCIDAGKPMVTTSYVSDAMGALDAEAKAAGILVLNEIGVDPGIDHMSAMKIIHDVEARGGRTTCFRSCCGGLPAPEANTNPFGYKFSWSPRGVVLAGKNPARYLEDGVEINIPGPELFSHHWPLTIEGLGEFETYPNRDSLPYMDTYGLESLDTMFRGTIRNRGWCDVLKAIVDIGFVDESERNLTGMCFADLILSLIGASAEEDPRVALSRHLGIAIDSEAMNKLDWIGLLGNDPLPAGSVSALDVLAARLLERLEYGPDERDMIILQHEFIAAFDDRSEKITSTLIDFGVPGGDSAMARTVSLPAAIACRMILDGEIGGTGVKIPVEPAIYTPVLEELEKMGIRFTEKTTEID